jgi:hypothetical protein
MVAMEGETLVTATFLKKPDIVVTPKSVNFGAAHTCTTSDPKALII